MKKILAISDSRRSSSAHPTILRALIWLAPEDTEIEIYDGLATFLISTPNSIARECWCRSKIGHLRHFKRSPQIEIVKYLLQ